MVSPEIIQIGGSNWLFTVFAVFMILGIVAGLAGAIAVSPQEKRRKMILTSILVLMLVYGLSVIAGIPSSYTRVYRVEITSTGDWILKNALGLRLDTLPVAEPKRIEWYDGTFTVLRPRHVTYLSGLRIVTTKRTYDTVAYNVADEGDLRKIESRLNQHIEEAGVGLPEDLHPPLPNFFWRYQQDLIMLIFFLCGGSLMLSRYIKSFRKPSL